MANEDTEKIPDIVDEIRHQARVFHDAGKTFAEFTLTDYADRIEAAWKRELVANTDTLGNAAAMREALIAVKKSIDGIGASSLDCDPTILMAALTQVCARLSARIERALAAPARNCDVGTAEEQSARYDEFCYQHRTIENCCAGCPAETSATCELKWAQIPYEEGEARDGKR